VIQVRDAAATTPPRESPSQAKMAEPTTNNAGLQADDNFRPGFPQERGTLVFI